MATQRSAAGEISPASLINAGGPGRPGPRGPPVLGAGTQLQPWVPITGTSQGDVWDR